MLLVLSVVNSTRDWDAGGLFAIAPLMADATLLSADLALVHTYNLQLKHSGNE